MQPLFVNLGHIDLSPLAVFKYYLWRAVLRAICQLRVLDRNVRRLGVPDHLLHCCNFDVEVCVDRNNFFALGLSFPQLFVCLTDDAFIQHFLIQIFVLFQRLALL